jgi:RNA polymerase sigma-54 factor
MQSSLRLDRRQHQTLSPRLQHAVRLLQMSSVDFVQELRDMIGNNPFLEQDEGDVTDELEAVPAATRIAELADAPLDDTAARPMDGIGDTVEAEVRESAERTDDERDPWTGDGSIATRRTDESRLGALDFVAARTGLRAHLHEQLDVLPLPERDLVLAKTVVESLDDDGYLRQPLDDLLQDSEIDPAPDAEELAIALRRVQSLEPAGVAARNVAECLLLQLPRIPCPEQRATARAIVAEHLDRLAARDVQRLAQLLGKDPAHVDAACESIRRLDPRPGWRFDGTHAPYVVPDVIVRRVRGRWTATLNPTVLPRVRINQVYAELFQRHRCSHDAELANHLQEARWTLRNVEQRFVTILSVAQAIIDRQWRFFELGPMAMKPLGLKEIAGETGMHESTVSRVTNNKYMATPLGVFELKHFFSRAMTSVSGNTYSGTAIRGLIRDMIRDERPHAPLSDAQIARLLAQQGLVVARRTVTKYRQALRIDPVERRRVHPRVAR